MKIQKVYLYDHATGEKFAIEGFESFIEWLNGAEDSLSFSLKGFEDFKKYDEEQS
jgi:hypothetical protein